VFQSGKRRTVLEKPVLSAPLEPKHVLNSYASSTPACDGQRVYALSWIATRCWSRPTIYRAS
jgi:hypothetical protein